MMICRNYHVIAKAIWGLYHWKKEVVAAEEELHLLIPSLILCEYYPVATISIKS